ncbi:hypothetical protein [Streptomyces sp. NPDC002215]|uniref:hypothetical protein n=1 Tax=Streptomyces sp. NPDC002215 TaxID=3154412 RepID=UPI003321A101
MKVTPSGYVCTRPDILESLREQAAPSLTHRPFVETAITAFEEQGPDADPLLNRCPQHIARLIFDEVTEAYDQADRAKHDAASTTTTVRDFTLPYTTHRRAQARRAEHNRRTRNATGVNRIRARLTIG